MKDEDELPEDARDEPEEPKAPKGAEGEPWAKTSSGDAEHVTDDDA